MTMFILSVGKLCCQYPLPSLSSVTACKSHCFEEKRKERKKQVSKRKKKDSKTDFLSAT